MKRESFGDKIFIVSNHVLLGIVALLTLYPLIFVLVASISDPLLVNNGEVWLMPKGVNFDGYARVFQSWKILLGYKNTVFYSILGTIISIFVTFTCVYPLTVKNCRLERPYLHFLH